MPSISGNLQHAGQRNGSIGSYTNLVGFSICLYSPSTSNGIYTKTDSSGNFIFNNVPAGTYIVVECAKENLGQTSPADFSTATTITAPIPSDPDYSQIPTPISNTNTVDSLSVNTFNITLSTTNISGLNFIDSTIKNVPLSIPSGVIVQPNILINAANGTFGTLPAGTPVNTSPPSYPYPNAITAGQLSYGQGASKSIFNGANWYTLENINREGWFLTSNHTTFDERGYQFLINAGDPNAVLFKETISVKPNTYYLAGAWLNMITNYPNTCKIGFRALASDNTTQLFYGETTDIKFQVWGQIGQIFNTKNNSSISLQVLSMSDIGGGNDFALDDITLQEVTFNTNVSVTKAVNKGFIKVDDIITYTNTIVYTSALTSTTFYDTVPDGTTFVPSSVKINGISNSSYNPNLGFPIPNANVNTIITVTFDVVINTIPKDGFIYNSSDLYYSTEIIPNNPINGYILSNTVSSVGLSPKISISKYTDKNFAVSGETITYTILISNTGNFAASDLVFSDTIPTNSSLIPSSITLNNNSVTGTEPVLIIPISSIPPSSVFTIVYSVKV